MNAVGFFCWRAGRLSFFDRGNVALAVQGVTKRDSSLRIRCIQNDRGAVCGDEVGGCGAHQNEGWGSEEGKVKSEKVRKE